MKGMKAWSKANPIMYGGIRSLVQLVSVHEIKSEGFGLTDQATLIFFNLIRLMVLFGLVSTNTTHPPVHSKGYSLKHTAEQWVQHWTTQQRLHSVHAAWPICSPINQFMITGNFFMTTLVVPVFSLPSDFHIYQSFYSNHQTNKTKDCMTQLLSGIKRVEQVVLNF